MDWPGGPHNEVISRIAPDGRRRMSTRTDDRCVRMNNAWYDTSRAWAAYFYTDFTEIANINSIYSIEIFDFRRNE